MNERNTIDKLSKREWILIIQMLNESPSLIEDGYSHNNTVEKWYESCRSQIKDNTEALVRICNC